MNSNWAEENLQTIRILMERTALYRRALAPIMLLAGLAGIAGGLIGWYCHLSSNKGFIWLWIGVAIFSLAGALLQARRQALKDSEPFWSPPTRRVGQALGPGFFIGLLVAILVLVALPVQPEPEYPDDFAGIVQTILMIFWTFCYGCAVHAAGFFVSRGMRWFGWVFLIIGTGIVVGEIGGGRRFEISPHLLMAAIFGGLHLAYGIYLYFTEKKNPAA
jgi:hypothetical protein